ncbi:MAG TPA: tetratricopeptide repeat protein [Pirellulales bacterium]
MSETGPPSPDPSLPDPASDPTSSDPHAVPPGDPQASPDSPESGSPEAEPPAAVGPIPSRWITPLPAADFPHVALDASYRRPVAAYLAKPGDAASDWLEALLDGLARELNGKIALALVSGFDLPEDVAPALGAVELPALFAFRQGRRIAELRPTKLPGWPHPTIDGEGNVVPSDASPEHLAEAASAARDVLRGVLLSWVPGPQESAETARRLQAEHEFALTLRSRRLVVAARAKLGEEPREAERLFRQAWECEPDNATATLGLAEAFLEQKRFSDCRRLLSDLGQRGLEVEGVDRLHARLRIREPFPDPIEDVEMMLDDLTDSDAEPTLERLLHAAQAAAALDDFDLALETALKVVQRDREVLGPAAQRLMEDVFHIVGLESELTQTYRRRLTESLD